MARPLHHPDIDDLTVAGLLYALSDPTRLAIVEELFAAEVGLSCRKTLDQLNTSMPKSTCSQHFQILREAGLIECRRKGVELENRLRYKEIEKRFPGLLSSILKANKNCTEGKARHRRKKR